MVRMYRRKTQRALIPEADVKNAVKDVLRHKISFRAAALKYGLSYSLVFKRVKMAKMKKNPRAGINEEDSGASSSDEETIAIRGRNKYCGRQVFSDEEEKRLKDYMLKASNIHYGLTTNQARSLAFEYAVKLDTKYPNSWDENKKAGKDWVIKFIKKHGLSVRKPENTSLARATAFNRPNIEVFQKNLNQILDKFKLTPERIFNLDETGITTVLPPPKVITKSGQKQVGQISSAERGELVTMCAIVSASGNSIPPVYLFPRVNMKDYFMHNAPIGAIGFANRTGWMTAEIFPQVLDHIKRHTSCTVENPVLLLIDNHSSHVSLASVTFAKENGLILLSFPPHCTHRLQPLDIAVFGPFKAALRVAFNDYLKNHPGKTIGIQHICEISRDPFMIAFNQRNITSGFSKPGIWPINNLVFTDDDFAATYATDRRMLANENISEPPQAGTSRSQSGEATPESRVSISDSAPMPEDVRPFPKCLERKESNRAKVKSTIYTDSPEKAILEEKERNKALKVKKNFCLDPQKGKKRKKGKHEANEEAELSSDSDPGIELLSEGEGDDWGADLEEDRAGEINLLHDFDVVSKDDFVVVKFPTKTQIVYYVGIIEERHGFSDFDVNFLRRKGDKFHYPDVADISSVTRDDIIAVLPAPRKTGGTERARRYFHFDVNFSGYEPK